MGLLKRLLVAATGLTLAVGTAAADTTVKWLHIEVNPAQVKIWDEVARAYEAAHPGVKVEMQFLENEAYKAKLPTILQSKDRPHVIYSWAGGVLKAQIEAGVLEDITDQVKGYSDTHHAGGARRLHAERPRLRPADRAVAGRFPLQQGIVGEGQRRRRRRSRPGTTCSPR